MAPYRRLGPPPPAFFLTKRGRQGGASTPGDGQGAGRGHLFGEDQLAVGRDLQAVVLAVVFEDHLAVPLQQLAYLDTFEPGAGRRPSRPAGYSLDPAG